LFRSFRIRRCLRFHEPVARADDVYAGAADVFGNGIANLDTPLNGDPSELGDNTPYFRFFDLAVRADADDGGVRKDRFYAGGQRAHRVREFGGRVDFAALAFLSGEADAALRRFAENTAAVRADDADDLPGLFQMYCIIHCAFPPDGTGLGLCRRADLR